MLSDETMRTTLGLNLGEVCCLKRIAKSTRMDVGFSNFLSKKVRRFLYKWIYTSATQSQSSNQMSSTKRYSNSSLLMLVFCSIVGVVLM